MEGFVFLLDACRKAPRQLPEPWVSGRDLIALGGTPGKHFGKILSEIFDAQITGELASREEALARAAEYLKE